MDNIDEKEEELLNRKEKGVTTLGQSRALIELGLDPLTSDMSYELVDNNYGLADVWELRRGLSPAVRMDLFSYRNGMTVPAWSLYALMKAIPPSPNGSITWHMERRDDGVYVFNYDRVDGVKSVEDFKDTDHFTVVYKMVMWRLIENRRSETGIIEI